MQISVTEIAPPSSGFISLMTSGVLALGTLNVSFCPRIAAHDGPRPGLESQPQIGGRSGRSRACHHHMVKFQFLVLVLIGRFQNVVELDPFGR